MGQTYISTEHLLLGILREDSCGALRVLSELGIEADAVRSALNDLVGKPSPVAPGMPFFSGADPKGDSSMLE